MTRHKADDSICSCLVFVSARSPVYGAFRGAVIGPALTPGYEKARTKLQCQRFVRPVHVASRWSALAWATVVDKRSEAHDTAKPLNGTRRRFRAHPPGVNAGPKTASRKAP